MRRWAAPATLGLLVCAALVVRYVLLPSAEPALPADAVVLLAGDDTARLPLALRLAQQGPGVLVVSVDQGADNAPARELCGHPGGLVVDCFTSPTSDTRHEARALAAVVASHGWRRIAVVTSNYHVTRAGLLIRRCTDAEVAVVGARGRLPAGRLAVATVRETAGLVVAAAARSC